MPVFNCVSGTVALNGVRLKLPPTVGLNCGPLLIVNRADLLARLRQRSTYTTAAIAPLTSSPISRSMLFRHPAGSMYHDPPAVASAPHPAV